MALSILHRVTGVALVVGTFAVIWLLLAAATGEAAYDRFAGIAASMPGQILLFGWTVALFYHSCNGVRHLFWDVGCGYELKTAYRSAYLVLAVTALLSAIVWVPVLLGRG